MTKRQFDLDKIKSNKTRRIIKDAISVAERLEEIGENRMAERVERLIRSRIMSQATNSAMAEDLRAALGNNSSEEKENG